CPVGPEKNCFLACLAVWPCLSGASTSLRVSLREPAYPGCARETFRRQNGRHQPVLPCGNLRNLLHSRQCWPGQARPGVERSLALRFTNLLLSEHVSKLELASKTKFRSAEQPND